MNVYHIFVILILVGCQKENALSVSYFDFLFKGDTFNVHNNQDITIGLVNRESKNLEFRETQTIQDGKFEVKEESILAEHENYFLDYYVDMNANGSCDEPPVDHSWRMEIDDVPGDISFTGENLDNYLVAKEQNYAQQFFENNSVDLNWAQTFLVESAARLLPYMNRAISHTEDLYGSYSYWNTAHRISVGMHLMEQARNH